MQEDNAPQAPKRRRVDPLLPVSMQPDNSEMLAQLRRLVQASCAQRQYSSAVWFADKLVTAGGQQPEDVLLLASCLYHNGELQHAVHVLTHHGLIDTVKHRHPSRIVAEAAGMAAAVGSGGVAVDPSVARSVTAALTTAAGAASADPISGAVTLASLPAFLLAAQCYKALKAWDR